MRQMEGRVEDVEGSIAELVVGELGLLERRSFVDDHEGAGMRSRTESEVDEAGLEHFFRGQEIRDFTNVVAGRTEHTAASNFEAGGIGEDGGFHRELGGVGEGRDLADILIVLLGKRALGFGVAIVVDHTLDVACGDDFQPKRAQVAQQGHRNTGLIAIGVREHDARFIGFDLEDGADEGIQLGIHEHYVLAVFECVEHDSGGGFDGARNFEDHVNRAASGQDGRVGGKNGHAACDLLFGFVRRIDEGAVGETSLAEGALRVFRCSVGNRHQPHARNRRSQLQGDGSARCSGAHHADANRVTGSFQLLQGSIDTHCISPVIRRSRR